MKKVNILGSQYTILWKKWDEEPLFEKRSWCGYQCSLRKEIIILDLMTVPEGEYDKDEAEVMMKETLRHEIIHAFLDESGLKESALPSKSSWARNEEMVDWIALQFSKISKVFLELGV